MARSTLREIAYALSAAPNALDPLVSDGAAAYASWAAAVKAAGGVVSAFPVQGHTIALAIADFAVSEDAYGYPASRYPRSVILPGGSLSGSLFSAMPDAWTPDQKYGYYLAPQAVLNYYANGGLVTYDPTTAGGLDNPNPLPTWYTSLSDNVKGTVKTVAIIGGVVVGVMVLNDLAAFSRLVPRANPPRRRSRGRRRRS